ncbi:hypothetical protein [Metallibacterium scheffleri]
MTDKGEIVTLAAPQGLLELPVESERCTGGVKARRQWGAVVHRDPQAISGLARRFLNWFDGALVVDGLAPGDFVEFGDKFVSYRHDRGAVVRHYFQILEVQPGELKGRWVSKRAVPRLAPPATGVAAP